MLSQSSGASFDVAAAFGLPVNTPVFHVVCVHEENGRPIQLEDRYVNRPPRVHRPGFQVEPPSEYLFNNVSHELEIEHVVDASLPTGEQARLLDMRADEPCLTLTRTGRTGSPSRSCTSCIRATATGSARVSAGRRTPPDLIPFPMDARGGRFVRKRPPRRHAQRPRQIARACPASRDHTTGNSG